MGQRLEVKDNQDGRRDTVGGVEEDDSNEPLRFKIGLISTKAVIDEVRRGPCDEPRQHS